MITEKQFEAQVKDLAKIYGWLYYHTWRSIHSPVGFPDCVLVRPPRLIFAELKTEKGKLTPEQGKWLETLERCQVSRGFKALGNDIYDIQVTPEVYLWRPDDLEKIAEILALT